MQRNKRVSELRSENLVVSGGQPLLTEKFKAWVDAQSYEQLLRRWRGASPGDETFQGEQGSYYSQAMAEKRNVDPERAVTASKRIGW